MQVAGVAAVHHPEAYLLPHFQSENQILKKIQK
jgi:hypothetical protein